MDVSEDFLSVLKSSYDILAAMQAKHLDKKQEEEIKTLALKMDRLYYDTINLEISKEDEIVTLAHAYLLLSRIHIFEAYVTKNLAISRIMKCKHLLKGKELDRKCFLTALQACYDLGNLYRQLNNKELSLSTYNEAFQLYLTYTKEEDVYLTPLHILQYFGIQDITPKTILHKTISLVVLRLLSTFAESETVNPTYFDQIIMCQHKILTEELDKLSSPDKLLAYWAEVAATTSEFFVTRNRFTEARDYIALASLMSKRFYEDVYMKMDEKKYSNERAKMYTNYEVMLIDIAECWAYYGIQLLRSSKQNILCGAGDNVCAACDLKASPATSEKESNKLLLFSEVKHDLEVFTAMITDKNLLTYADATAVFQITIKYLKEAESYYKREKNLMLYMMMILHMSRVHKYYAFYVNKIKKVELHKQRQQILLAALKIVKGEDNLFYEPLMMEVIIAVNDIINAMCENAGLRWNQLSKLAAGTTEDTLLEVDEMARTVLKTCRLWFTRNK